MYRVFLACLGHDLCVLWRNPSQWFHPIVFFTIFIALFGIGIGFNSHELVKLSPAIMWVAFLLTTLFSIDTLFRSEQEEGTLEPLLLSPYPLWWLMLAKSLALWVGACLPLMLIVPFLGVSLQLSFLEISVLTLTLFVGSLGLTFMGVLGAALTLTMPRSGIFLGLLLLPLYVPILILGESAILSILSSQWPLFQIALLGSMSVLAVTFVPHATAAALKAAID